MAPNRVTERTVAQARKLLIEMHHNSGVGHLGGNLSVIDALALVFLEFKRPEDRVVLSKGHSAGALYVCLALAGRIPEEELSTFHKDGTRLPGHPPTNTFDDIPFATGSLGHGLSLSTGMAMAARAKGTGGHVYCVMSDGEWQEGSTWEALWFARHQQLDNLTMVIDMNGLQGFGSTSEIASMTDLADRVGAHGVAVTETDGHDLDALRDALSLPSNGRPRAVFAKTVKGHGVAAFEDTMRSHYVPLSDEAAYEALEKLRVSEVL